MGAYDQILETWQIHNRINLYLLDGIDEAALGDPIAKARNPGDQFGHIHNVRLMWLKSTMPELLEGLSKLEKGASKLELAAALAESGEAVGKLISARAEAGGKVKGFKPNLTAFVAYLISHESHHRGQLELGLRQAGHPIDEKISYGLWEWGVR